MEYSTIIGLEIHAELKTKSKMFCSCRNESEEAAANTNVCPICLGHPGTLPVPNRQAIEWTIMAGLAINCQINRSSKFDRKNYFYPDLPKGYQISQYDLPLAYNGYLDIDGEKIAVTRIHLEEDTGKSLHRPDGTLLDFNRAGTPLIELVSEPVIKTAEEAKKFCQSYQKILRYLDISDADMEKGQMRCEANVSVQEKDSWEYIDGQIKAKPGKKLNAKVEVKNINSFKAVEKAIRYEIERQTKEITAGQEIKAETRGWNENKNETVSQRVKESSADYRYFPEPDIPPISVSEELLGRLKASLPELPEAKKTRFIEQYSLSPEIAEILSENQDLANWTEQVISELSAWIRATGDNEQRQEAALAKTAANWISGELFKHLKNAGIGIGGTKITAENFAEFICLNYQGKINSSAAQTILEKMFTDGGDPEKIMAELGLEQIDDRQALATTVEKIIKDNPGQAEEYRSGKTNIIQFLIGKTMAASGGKANPKIVKEILEEKLNK